MVRVLSFGVVRHVVNFQLETLLQRYQHLLELTLLGSNKIQFRLQTHLIILDSVDRIA